MKKYKLEISIAVNEGYGSHKDPLDIFTVGKQVMEKLNEPCRSNTDPRPQIVITSIRSIEEIPEEKKT